jgi:hypothetical protein
MKIMFRALLLFSGFALLLASCSDSNGDDTFGQPLSTDIVKNTSTASGKSTDKVPEISFDSDTYDFGKIKEGDKVKHAYKFKNTGKSNLIIGDAKGSCGCTVPKYPTKPIAPGEGGEIMVEFNSVGKTGTQSKTITLITNAEPSTRLLKIKGEVIPASESKR